MVNIGQEGSNRGLKGQKVNTETADPVPFAGPIGLLMMSSKCKKCFPA